VRNFAGNFFELFMRAEMKKEKEAVIDREEFKIFKKDLTKEKRELLIAPAFLLP
jgi:hypothetical protein